MLLWKSGVGDQSVPGGQCRRGCASGIWYLAHKSKTVSAVARWPYCSAAPCLGEHFLDLRPDAGRPGELADEQLVCAMSGSAHWAKALD